MDNKQDGGGKDAADSGKAQVAVGQTWSQIGNINLNLDNLLAGKGLKSETAPSMNQLKTQSPVKQQTFPPMASPTAGMNNNNNSNRGNIPAFFGGSGAAASGNILSPMSPTNRNFANNNNNFNAFQ